MTSKKLSLREETTLDSLIKSKNREKFDRLERKLDELKIVVGNLLERVKKLERQNKE